MRALLIGGLLVAAATPAFAQDAWGGRARLAISAGLQPEAQGFSQSAELLKHIEATPLTAVRDEGSAPFLDVGVIVPVGGRFGVNVAFSALSTSGTAAVNAGIPHPFFFETLRPVSGDASLERMEMALHGGLAFLVGGGPVDVVVSGGASWFRLRQDLVTDVEFDEAYPYDTASFVSATLSEVTTSKAGYHGAADFTWRLSRVWGIGALLRYSRAEIPLTAGDVEAVPVKVGGLQIAAGLRLTIP